MTDKGIAYSFVDFFEDIMTSQTLVDTLKPGNVFRDWLVHKFGRQFA